MTEQPAFNFGKVNLLILEEYLFISDVLSLMLKSFGIRKIHKARNWAEAKKICEQAASEGVSEVIDFAIIDLIPPNNHGLSFLNWLRNNDKTSLQYMPVIFTTNDAREKIIINGRDSGANEILVKPFTAYNVSHRLLSIINNPRAFVKSPQYRGPTRRRRQKEFTGIDKRLMRSENIEIVYEKNASQ